MSGMGKWWCCYEKSWDGCMCSKEWSRCICRIWLRQWGWRLALATQQWAQNLITWEVISQLIISIFHSTKWKITAPFCKSKIRVLSSKIKECGVWTYQAFMCVCVCSLFCRFERMLYQMETLDYKARERAGVTLPMLGSPMPVMLTRDAAIEVLFPYAFLVLVHTKFSFLMWLE